MHAGLHRPLQRTFTRSHTLRSALAYRSRCDLRARLAMLAHRPCDTDSPTSNSGVNRARRTAKASIAHDSLSSFFPCPTICSASQQHIPRLSTDHFSVLVGRQPLPSASSRPCPTSSRNRIAPSSRFSVQSSFPIIAPHNEVRKAVAK